MKRTYVTALTAVLTLWCPAQAAPQDAASKPSEAYQKLVADFDAASAANQAAVKAITGSDDYKKAVEAKDADALKKLREKIPSLDREAFVKRAIEAAGKATGDEAARYYVWALEHGATKDAANTAVDALIKDHPKSPLWLDLFESGSFVYLLPTYDPVKAEARLISIQQGTDSKVVKAWAIYTNSLRLSRNKAATEEEKARAAKLLNEAEELARGTLLADTIAAPRFEKEHLQVGMTAPDLAGEDLDGVPFKLSDYRGKVVVVDFWGSW